MRALEMQKARQGKETVGKEYVWGRVGVQKGDAAEEEGGLEGVKARVGEGAMGSGVKRERERRQDGMKEERWRDGGEGMKVKREMECL